MESDSFFCQLFKQLPETLFELLDLPATQAKAYRFDSVELKKSFRIDGLYLPNRATLPLYFVEVQFRRVQKFYANLFAKVFCYLEENDSKQDWVAVAIFPSRKEEPKYLGPYEDLLRSHRVHCIYLNELPSLAEQSPGLGILQLVSATPEQAKEILNRLVKKSLSVFGDADLGDSVLQLAEELLIRKYAQLGREEVRKMFHLEDLRKTRVWQEAHEEGKSLANRELAQKLLAKGMSPKQVAELTTLRIDEVKRLAKNRSTAQGDR